MTAATTSRPRPPVTSQVIGRPDPEVTFATTDEQAMLRDAARRFLRDTSPTARVRELMRTDAGFDDRDWRQAVALGWPSLAVPEAVGGAGMGWTELAEVAAEAGVSLTGLPVLSAAVMAPAAVRAAWDPALLHHHDAPVRGDAPPDAAAALLGRIAAGEVRATVAHRAGVPGADGAGRVLDLDDDGRASGRLAFVLDGGSADVLVALATVGGQGAALVEVDLAAARAEGTVSTTLLPTLDLTRKQTDLVLDGAATTVLATDALACAAMEAAAWAGAVFLANESVAGAAHVLAESVQYGKDRKQFGRAIGSYQALKHRMANTLKEVESARSTALHAARALDVGGPEVRIAVPMAVSWVGEVYERAAADHIQNLGGIGFTWEHDAHLWFKRAKSSKLLMGSPKAWRSLLADELRL